jgi:transcriptional regulator with XRE-family HTH domain
MPDLGLGTALRKLRERRTLSLREMSQLSEVDHTYVHRLETGEKTNPSMELVSKLLKVLKASEREASIVKWLIDHPDANPELVEFGLDDGTVTLEEFSMAAGSRHRGARLGPAKLIDQVRKVLNGE